MEAGRQQAVGVLGDVGHLGLGLLVGAGGGQLQLPQVGRQRGRLEQLRHGGGRLARLELGRGGGELVGEQVAEGVLAVGRGGDDDRGRLLAVGPGLPGLVGAGRAPPDQQGRGGVGRGQLGVGLGLGRPEERVGRLRRLLQVQVGLALEAYSSPLSSRRRRPRSWSADGWRPRRPRCSSWRRFSACTSAADVAAAGVGPLAAGWRASAGAWSRPRPRPRPPGSSRTRGPPASGASTAAGRSGSADRVVVGRHQAAGRHDATTACPSSAAAGAVTARRGSRPGPRRRAGRAPRGSGWRRTRSRTRGG